MRLIVDLVKAEQLSLFGGGASKPTAKPAAKPRDPSVGHKPPGAGWEMVPHSTHGGYRRRHGTGWEYWYPGKGITSTPHSDDAKGQEHGAAAAKPATVKQVATLEQPKGAGGADGGPGVLGAERSGQGVDRQPHAPEGGGKGQPKAGGGAAEPKLTAEQQAHITPVEAAALAVQAQPETLPDPRPVTTVEPPHNPAIVQHEDLLPPVAEGLKLPEHIRKFPNPTDQISELYPHQVEAAERILNSFQSCDGFMLASAPGLGKSNMAMAAMMAHGGERNLVVVPTSGKENLMRQWKGPDVAGLYNVDLKGKEGLHQGKGWFIVSYDEILEPVLDEKGEPKKDARGKPLQQIREGLRNSFDCIAFDECQSMKNADAGRAKAAKQLQEQFCKKAIYMSATPYQDITDMHYMLKLGLFAPGQEPFNKWAEFAGCERDGNKVKNPASYLPRAAVAATLHVDGKSLKQVPNLSGMTSEFGQIKKESLSPEQRKSFEIVDEIVKVAGDDLHDGFVHAMLVGWNKQYWETLKVDRAVELGRKALAEGKQVAFFTSYKEPSPAHLVAMSRLLHKRADAASMADPPKELEAERLRSKATEIERLIGTMPKQRGAIDRLVEEFGGSDKVSEIHGNTRKKAIDEQKAYQAGTKKVVVATIDKGGTGISLHDTHGRAGRVQINLSLPWSGVAFDQVSGRSHRLGSKSGTTMHWLIGDDDSEKHIAAMVGKRLKSMGAVTAGDPEMHLDSSALLAWEFGEQGTSEDAAAEAKAALEAADAGHPKALEQHAAEAAESRDFFRQFAEQRASGRNVLQERFDATRKAKAEAALREARRAAEQVRKHLGAAIHHDQAAGKFLLNVRNDTNDIVVGYEHNSFLRKQGAYYNGSLRAYVVPQEAMVAIAKKFGADGLKVDMNEVNRAEKERQQKAAAAAGASPQQARASTTGVGNVDETKPITAQPYYEAVAKRGLRVQAVQGSPGHVYITGNTFASKDKIKALGARWTVVPGYGDKAWVLPADKMAQLERDLSKARRLVLDLRKAQPVAAWA